MHAKMEKHDQQGQDHLEQVEAAFDSPTYSLSEPHKAYLIERHGTLELDPIPSMDPADPYNWPSWKVSNHNIYLQMRPKTYLV